MSIRRIAVSFAVFATLGCLQDASAGLGEQVDSVRADAVAQGGTVSTTSMPAYDRHEIAMPGGARVREFAARGGKVFAIDFEGPSLPDLKSMLGTHYDAYVAAAQARRGSHHVFSFEGDGIVMTIRKLPRGFAGSARTPALMPSGVAAQDLK